MLFGPIVGYRLKQLFEDILSIGKDETRKSYFIGSIVVKKDSEELLDPLAEVTLIDGQQRITTLTLIYCALCNYYKNIDERLCRNIYGNYLVNHDLDETNKLHLTKDYNLVARRRKNGSFYIPREEIVYLCMTSDFFIEEAEIPSSI